MGLFGKPNVEKMKNERNVRGLIKALSYQADVDVRINAAEALSILGNASAVDSLCKALKDKEYKVRKRAAIALGRIGDARAVRPLIGVLLPTISPLHEYAAEALVKIGKPAVDPLFQYIQELQKANDINAIAEVLNKIGDTGIIDELIKMVQGTNQTLRITATMLLGKLGDRKTPGHLVDLLDGKSEVASSAAKALDNLKWKPPKDARGARYYILLRKWNECLDIGEPAVDPLIECMINKSGGNEIDAAGILGKLNNQKAVKPLISMLNNPRKEARIAAARALINLYQSGCLDEKSQALILNNKEIIQTHKDGPITQGGSDCHSEVVGHGDSGIGVTFPV